MKTFFKIFLQYYLKILTQLVLLIHRPVIIVVAGSTNKHFIKQEIKNTLTKRGLTVRANPKNFNTEIGLPLAVLDLPSGYNSFKRWLPILFLALKKIFQKNFPKFLVLSLGSSDPGDMKYLLKIIKPRVAIISDITQRYLEGFNGLDDLLNEYKYLVAQLDKDGFLLINNDNPRIRSLNKNTKSTVISFGLSDDSDCHTQKIEKKLNGQNINVTYDNTCNDYFINRYGLHHVYAKMAGLIIEGKVADIIKK